MISMCACGGVNCPHCNPNIWKPNQPTESASVSLELTTDHSLKRIATALELILNQQEQQTALIASGAESLRILVEMAEKVND